MSFFGPVAGLRVTRNVNGKEETVDVPLDEDVLMCSVCMRQFVYPYTTPCGHTCRVS